MMAANDVIAPISEYYPHQLKMLELPDPTVDIDICCAVGGLGSGKTLAAVHLGLILSQRFPGSIGLVGHKYLSTLKSTVIKDYLDTLTSWGQKEGMHYYYNRSEQVLNLYAFGSSKVLFKSLEFPEDTLRSLNVDWAHIEEANLAGLNAYQKVIERVRRPGRNKTKRIVLTLNPTMRKDWIHDLFVRRAGKYRLTADEETVTINRRRVVSKTADNKALSAAYRLNLRETLSELQYKALVEGEDVMFDSGLVLPNWTSENEDIKVMYDPNRRIYLSCDFNLDPMSWVLAHVTAYQDGSFDYEFFDEICYGPCTVKDAAEMFVRRYKNHTAGITVTGDSSGRAGHANNETAQSNSFDTILNTFFEAGMENYKLDVPRKAPPVESRHEVFISRVRNADGDVFIKVNPERCPKLYYVLTNMEWLVGADGFVIKSYSRTQIERDSSGLLKYHFHPYDAASYLVYQFDGKRKDPEQRPKQVYKEIAYRNPKQARLSRTSRY